jgi:hypothetical protein
MLHQHFLLRFLLISILLLTSLLIFSFSSFLLLNSSLSPCTLLLFLCDTLLFLHSSLPSFLSPHPISFTFSTPYFFLLFFLDSLKAISRKLATINIEENEILFNASGGAGRGKILFTFIYFAFVFT